MATNRHERKSDLSANSFASCLIDYIQGNITQDVTEVTVFSDGCAYKNRNTILPNALTYLAASNYITIKHKYLTKDIHRWKLITYIVLYNEN